MLFAQTGGRAAPGESLPFFTSYSVTGNYKVAGVDLAPQGAVDGFVSGTIQMSDVPDNAEILAALMYWETITDAPPIVGAVGATFRNQPITNDHAVSKSSAELGSSFAPCWTSGGGPGATYYLTMHRADVLQLLPLQFDASGNSTGRHLVNDADLPAGQKLTFSVPEAGNGNQVPQSAGASLFVLYRDPSPSAALAKVVVYDGLFVQTQGQAMEHTIRGFQDAADVSPVIKMTHIVGSGANNANDQVYFNGAAIVPTGTNSFARTSGGTSDRGWSNPTFTNLSFPKTAAVGVPSQDTQTDGQYGEWVTTRVDHGVNNSPNDCLSWAAIILSTTVQDTDGDGLTDKAETADDHVDGTGLHYGLKEPDDEKLPSLKAMDASPTHRDIFIEVGAMKANAETPYGSDDAPFSSTQTTVTDHVGHNHMPPPASLAMVGAAFAAAPADVRYLAAGSGIALHIDVGSPSAYRTLFSSVVDPHAADAYLVGATYARGGESIVEQACTAPCQFPAYPGTVSWKTGFGLYKEALLDHSRKDVFRYAFYAHAKATHRSPFPCLDASGDPVGPGPDPDPAPPPPSGNCLVAPHPEFFLPRGISGSGDYPGGDFLITLGFFDNTTFVGSDFVIASTTMHELGHTIGLGHGGDPLPNCKPNYVSVMNYMFQLGGLVDQDGVPHLGYSNVIDTQVIETDLSDHYVLPGLYRTSWYAPLPVSDTRTPAKRYCSGQAFDPALPSPRMVRVDGSFDAGTPRAIDWNADGDVDLGGSQDVNFDGNPEGTLTGYSDWASLRLNQTGSRRNIAGLSIDSDLLADGTRIHLGAVLLSDGSQLLSDGAQLLSDGASVRADGVALLGDGVALLGDGAALLGDGVQFLSDGAALLGDGVNFLSDGTKLLSDGTVLLSDGAVLLGDGSPLLGDGAVLLSDGATFLGDGVNFLGDGVALLGDGTRLLSDGAVFLGDGAQLLSDGAALTSNHNEVSPRFATESGNIPGPTALKACVINETSCVTPPLSSLPSVTLHRTRLDWKPPTVGTVLEYRLHRVLGTDVPLGEVPILATVPGTQTTYVEAEELPYNTDFTYFVDALVDGNPTSRSNYRTITALNAAPLAGTDVIADSTYKTLQDTVLVVFANGVLANDKAGADSFATSLKAVAFAGATSQGGTVALLADGSFTYTPKAGFFGTDTFTYMANNGPWAGDPVSPKRALSADSGSVLVTITVIPSPYEVTIQPLKTPAKLGTTVPIVFQVKRNGVVITSTNVVKEIHTRYKPLPASGVCPAATTIAADASQDEMVYRLNPAFLTGKSTLKYLSSQQSLQFNWDSASASSLPAPVTNLGCYVALIYFDDLDALGNPTAPRLTTVVQLK